METQFDGEDLDVSKLLIVRDRRGRTVITVGLVVTLYFEEPWTAEKRLAVAELAQSYIDEFRSELKWAQHPKTARTHPIDSRHIALPRDWLPQHEDPDESWEFDFSGGEIADSASPFSVSALGSARSPRRNVGYFEVALPLLWFADRSETFPEYVRGLCAKLRPISGLGGIGLLESHDITVAMDYQKLVRGIGARFPGLELLSNPVACNHMNQGIKGVNWLTVLSDRWVKELGGIDYLRIRLDESQFYFYPYDGGVIIQAGPRPQLGDAKVDRWPQQYAILSKVLQPIRVKDHLPMHLGNTEGLSDREATMAWINRFDGK